MARPRDNDDALERKAMALVQSKQNYWKHEVERLEAEIVRLRAALAWVMGEGLDKNGKWFEEVKPENPKPFWWRVHLRSLANEQEGK